MNRETESYFRELPEVHIQRSKIEKPHRLKTTWNIGDCVPIYVDEVLAGTSISMSMASVMRMATPLFPTMDNLYTDFLWFYVPYRLVWDHWANMWGENPNAWYPQIEYQVPQIKTTTNTNNQFGAKTIADYMGLPIDTPDISVSALPFRAYVKIWNDWFRSDPLQQEAPNVTNDTDLNAARTGRTTYTYRGAECLKANKLHDMFTSCLPSAQRGPEITLPLGDWAPVYPRTDTVTPRTGTVSALTWDTTSTSGLTTGSHNLYTGKTTSSAPTTTYQDSASYTASTGSLVYPNNLWTDLSNATAATVGELRTALAVQHFYETLARYGGGRYTEFLRAIFGVVSPDARLQRSEYLGGKRVPHNIATVVQTSSTDSTSPQGNTGAYSHTADADDMFTKSFTEPGVVMCIMVTRYKHTYNQGIPKMFLHKKWTDFYLPQFNGISEVPVYQKELYATGTSTDDEVFGYQEYGYEYRYMPDMVTAEMRTTYAQSLDAWHYADHYTQKPVLGASWIAEDKSNVDRTLVVSSGLSNQMLGDFYFNPTYVLPMPIYSIPGMDKI